MVSRKSKQMISGKSFEYALLAQFEEKLKDKTQVQIIQNSSFLIAKECFECVSEMAQSEYSLSASFAVNFLMDIEPRLSHDIGKGDVLQLEILSDDQGKKGDVRDVLAIRLVQKWEIGVSAKNNHHAVKHSRLSSDIDFEKFLGIRVLNDFRYKTILFKNINYPIVEVTLPEFGTVNISVEKLNNKLITSDGFYVSEEASFIDEKIFFFIEDDYIYKPKSEIRNYLMHQGI